MNNKKILPLFVALTLTSTALAQTTNSWVAGSNGTFDWFNGTNWSGGAAPNATNSRAIFTTTLTNSGVAWTNTSVTLGSIVTSNASGNVVIGNNGITTDVLNLATSSGTPTIDIGAGGTLFMYADITGNQGFTKTGSGVLSFRFNQNPATFSGNVNLNGGQLLFQSDGSFGDAANDIIFAGNTVLMNASSSNGIVTLGSGRTVIINTGISATLQNNSSTTFTVFDGAVTGAGNLTVAGGNGSYTLNGANTYSGVTTLTNSAKMTLGASGVLSTNNLIIGGSVGAILNLGGTSQTVRNLAMSSANAGTQRITNGSLIINGDANIGFTSTINSTVSDLSGLNNFTFNRANREFGASANGANVTNTLNFASGANTITATNIRLGGGGANAVGQMTTVKLGEANTWNAGTDVFLGNFQGNANVSFLSGLTNPSLTVRGLMGGSSAVPIFRVANTSSGNQPTLATLDLTGGSLDLIATELSVSYHVASANTASTGTLTMPAGTVVATTLNLAGKSASTGTPTVTGTMNQSGGTVTADNVYLGGSSGTALANFIANYNLTGGTLFAANIGGLGSYGTNTVRNLNINGGEVQNKAGGDLAINGVDATTQGRINVVLDASGGTFEADSGRAVNIGANTLISGSGALNKTGAGTLAIAGVHTYAGNTTASLGVLKIDGDISSSAFTTIDSPASLTGTGILGTTTINGIHSPGNSPGIQTITGDLSYGATAELNWELISNATIVRGTDFDGVNVDGNLSITSGAKINLVLNGGTTDFNNSFWTSNQSWLVLDITGAGTTTGNFAIGTVSLDSAGNDYSAYGSFATSVDLDQDLYLEWTAVPEPSTYALLALAAAGFGAHVLRRRNRR